MSTNTQNTEQVDSMAVNSYIETAAIEAATSRYVVDAAADDAQAAEEASATFKRAIGDVNELNGGAIDDDTIDDMSWGVGATAKIVSLINREVEKIVEGGTDGKTAVDAVFSNELVMKAYETVVNRYIGSATAAVKSTCDAWIAEKLEAVDDVEAIEAVGGDALNIAPDVVTTFGEMQTFRFVNPQIVFMTKAPADKVAEDAKSALDPYFNYLRKEANTSATAAEFYRKLDALIDDRAASWFNETDLAPSPIREEHENEADDIALADFKRDSSFQNHSLAMKSLSGLEAIARGEKRYQLSPRSSASSEEYVLTASQDDCEKLFSLRGISTEHVRSVLQAVYDLRTSRSAEGFVTGGRIWFTTGTILKEMLRTTGGTIREPSNSKASLKIVDAALLAASGARIQGIGPDGNVLNVDYFINAKRRDSVKYRGLTYRDVWGFLYNGDDAKTLNDYAMQIGQAHRYPLLNSDAPMDMGDVWVYDYILDMINEASGKLYPNGAKTAKHKTCTIRRSWSTIFDKASPMKALDSRKKKNVVERFDEMLKKVAPMAKDGDVSRNGRPLYITAWSEREAGRGRGAGAWKNLVLECHVDTVRPQVDLIGASSGK